MSHFRNFFLVGLCFLCGVRRVDGATSSFTPGCSFVNDQCVYSVQLGHEKQCDQTGPTSQGTSNSSCCNNVRDLVDEMRNRMDSLQKQMDLLQATSGTAASRNGSDIGDNTDILEELRRVTAELVAIKGQMTSEKEAAANEIQHLHESLANSTASLHRCQKAIGMENTVDSVDALDAGNHSVLYCDFDEDLCGFQVIVASQGFGRQSTPLSSSGQGPSVDHSRGVKSGHVVGLDTYTAASVDRTYSSSVKRHEVRSPVFPPSPSSYCFVFWYMMKGPDVQDLFVNAYVNGGAGYPVFNLHGRHSNEWEMARVELDPEYITHDFQIGFEFTTTAYRSYVSGGRYRNMNMAGSIAIDDLYIYNTTCNNIPRYPVGALKNVINGTTSYYTFHTEPRDWTEAYQTCRKQSAWSSLVSIESLEEQQFLVDSIRKDTTLSLVGQSGFYTSGTDKDVEHTFVWTNTGIPERVPGGFWHQGQPNNVGGNQDCLLLQYASDGYRWGDVECDTRHPFICEVH